MIRADGRPRPVTPYERLMQKAMRLASQVKCPQLKRMWFYPKDKLTTGWSLADLNERVQAADALGWDTVLVSDSNGLNVMYRKRPESELL